MKKLFLAVSSMIVTGFLMKSYKKLREKPDTEEENATFNRMSITDNRFDTSDPYGIKMTWSRWRQGGSCD